MNMSIKYFEHYQNVVTPKLIPKWILNNLQYIQKYKWYDIFSPADNLTESVYVGYKFVGVRVQVFDKIQFLINTSNLCYWGYSNILFKTIVFVYRL